MYIEALEALAKFLNKRTSLKLENIPDEIGAENCAKKLIKKIEKQLGRRRTFITSGKWSSDVQQNGRDTQFPPIGTAFLN